MKTLQAYNNDTRLKEEFLAEIEKHRKADQILQGTYGEGAGKSWRGCAVGCSIHSLNQLKGKHYRTSNHSVYETELGVPEWLARLEDTIFEGLPVEKAKKWPGQFAKAIPVGANLEPVKWRFCAFILSENIERVLTLDIADDLKKQVVDATRQVMSVHKEAIKTGEWNESAARAAAESAARAAAESAARAAAESAAWSAAESAARAAAESAARAAAWARSAAWSAAESAESAAGAAAWSAARAAAWSARSAAWSARSAAWSAAESAARAAAFEQYAKKLLSLLRAA